MICLYVQRRVTLAVATREHTANGKRHTSVVLSSKPNLAVSFFYRRTMNHLAFVVTYNLSPT